MRIIAYTPRGMFKGEEHDYTEETYQGITHFLEKLPDLTYFSFSLAESGEIYFTKAMIDESVFVLQT